MLTAKDYFIANLQDEKDKTRKEIRLLKNKLKQLDAIQNEIINKTEKELLDTLVKDEDLKKDYYDLKEKAENKEREEIKRMVKEGKLREIFYDKHGKEIKTDD